MGCAIFENSLWNRGETSIAGAMDAPPGPSLTMRSQGFDTVTVTYFNPKASAIALPNEHCDREEKGCLTAKVD